MLASRKALNLLWRFPALSNNRFASTLVIAEHNDEKLNGVTLNAITAAKKLGGDISVFVAGGNAEKVANECANIADVKTVIYAQDKKLEHQLSERVTDVLLTVQKKFNFSHVVGGASAFSRSVIPRFAAVLDVSPISEVTDIHDENTFSRPIFAGNATAKVKSKDVTKCFTVRTSAFQASSNEGGSASVEKAPDATINTDLSEFVSQELSKSERPELGAAKTVISGGRGLKSGDNFKILYELADELGAAVGASRAAVDSGFVPNDMQVGQTGKIVAPQLYIAVGISGAIQHLAGMKDSKVIVAINTDKDAPIFQVADIGLAQDLFKAVPEMTAEVKKQRK